MTSPLVADVAVRPATADDAATITAVQLAAWRERLGPVAVESLDEAAVLATWAAAISSPPDRRGRVLVATAGPRTVGFAAAAPSAASLAGTAQDGTDDGDGGWTAELVALEVAAPDRRQGHGSRLLAAVVDLARERGAHHVGAWCLREDGERSTFLTSAGLAEAGVRRVLATPAGEVEEFLLTGALGPREPAPGGDAHAGHTH
ncbi:GNAT family N-acetyltransferase [Serinibacter arcticus]|uniref:GNAT family N-acetyltransferase n=1 Tax=Serinibacter arcticus TaxID=1655435 RepID=A0A2U1ZZL6_9MICO|nr:GNAT family N-acetyltransferase [Serinibacter arcticus]PWD52362.1 GNAT family N-acetyltransferase [Serinibacter arcticus]